MENVNLDLFLMDMGILPKQSPVEDLEDVVDPRWKYKDKGYFRDPRDENGEVSF